jgi:hypothetical protein
MTEQSEQQVFVVPVSARPARQRAQHVVVGGIPGDVLRDTMKGQLCAPLEDLERAHGVDRFHLWGVRATIRVRGTWNRIAPGDWFLFVSRGFLFAAARVFGTCDSKETATALWGPLDGSDFRLLVVFDEVVATDVSVWDYRPILGSRFVGFRRLSDDFRATLLRKYGSVDQFARVELAQATRRESN